MARPIRSIAAAAALVALFASGGALAVTKLDDGMATRLDPGADGPTPGNRVTRVSAGTDFAHFVQYSGLPAGRNSHRCVLTEPSGKVQVDETELVDDLATAGFAYCFYETDSNDAELGSLNMVMYLNGERVGEQTLEVAPGPGKGLSLRKQYKYALGGLALLIMAGFWLRKQFAGRGEKGAAPGAVVIGAKLGAANAVPEPALASDAARELQSTGAKYRTLMGQADKAKGVALGRTYLAMLVKDREAAKAFEVFKECLAADASFRPERGEDVLPIARAARAAGDPKAAVAVVRGFDKAYPGHAAIPEVFMFSAQLLAEELKNADMARKILQHLLQKYPGHFVAAEAKRYLQGMAQPA
jgi:hypothetical protein